MHWFLLKPVEKICLDKITKRVTDTTFVALLLLLMLPWLPLLRRYECLLPWLLRLPVIFWLPRLLLLPAIQCSCRYCCYHDYQGYPCSLVAMGTWTHQKWFMLWTFPVFYEPTQKKLLCDTSSIYKFVWILFYLKGWWSNNRRVPDF